MNKKSVTLAETVIAVVILSICVLGLFATFVAGKKQIARAKRRLTAINYARMAADSLKSAVRQDTFNTGALACANNPGTPCAPVNFPLPSGDFTTSFGGSASYRVENIAFDLSDPNNPNKWMRRVTITVQWNEPS